MPVMYQPELQIVNRQLTRKMTHLLKLTQRHRQLILIRQTENPYLHLQTQGAVLQTCTNEHQHTDLQALERSLCETVTNLQSKLESFIEKNWRETEYNQEPWK